MTFTLQIIFSGLLAFVPVDTNGDTKPDKAWVLFVDARVPSPHLDAAGKLFDSHMPAIRVRKKNFQGGREPARWIGSGANAFGIVVLDEEDLTIGPLAGAPPFEVVTKTRLLDAMGKPRPKPCCTDSTNPPCKDEADAERKCHGQPVSDIEQMRDFEWVPSVDEIWPGKVISTDLLAKPLSRLGILAARLELPAGSLETSLLDCVKESTAPQERYKHPCLVRMDNKPRGSKWEDRATARQLLLTITGLTEPVKIASSRFGGATPAFSDLVLKPEEGCTSDCVVTIRVYNSMLSEVYGVGGVHHSSERHFELLWNLVDPSLRDRPAALRVAPPDDDVICPVIRP